MNEFDTLVFDQLDAFTPEPEGRPDWQDVVGRARKWRARRIVVALAAALAVLGSAAGVTAALGGFDKWLSGEPGKPAPKAEQERFEAANARSLAAFPKGTKLRELIRADVDGKQYVLYGFRSGHSLCLRLKAVSLGHSTGPACAPASALVHAKAPILVVQDDYAFADRHARPSAEVSFGIATDGVSRIDVHAVDGKHRALLGGNAYLWVENEPNTGNRVWRISAVGADGLRRVVPVSTSFGWLRFDASPPRAPRGPTRLQARIRHPTVGWYFRREPRGFPLSRLNLVRPPTTGGGFARLVKPDPLSDTVVGLTGNLCLMVVHHGGLSEGCSPGRSFWARGPLNVMLTGASDQFYSVSGVAADGVRHVDVFLAGGGKQTAPLRDNLFTTLVAETALPVRLVGYDHLGRVVGVETMPILGAKIPASARQLRSVQRVAGPNGTTGLIRVGATAHGFRCWRVDFSTGDSPGACMQLFPTGPWIQAGVQPAGRDLFVVGQVRPPVVSVELRFADGDVITTRPVARIFVLSVPRAHLSSERQLAYAVGYDSSGHRIQRQGIVFKTAP